VQVDTGIDPQRGVVDRFHAYVFGAAINEGLHGLLQRDAYRTCERPDPVARHPPSCAAFASQQIVAVPRRDAFGMSRLPSPSRRG
jgi:hypothetical protein